MKFEMLKTLSRAGVVAVAALAAAGAGLGYAVAEDAPEPLLVVAGPVAADDPAYDGVEVRVLPGLSAVQAVAARAGAPIGGDFAVVSLSDRLKPWSVVERRWGRWVAGASRRSPRRPTWSVSRRAA